MEGGATVFGYYVNDPERYGVIEGDVLMGLEGINKQRRFA